MKNSAIGERLPASSLVLAIVREALASVRSTPIVAIVVIAMIAGMCAAIVLANGRAIASERAVIATIGSAGTRSITLTARAGQSFDSGLVDRAFTLSDVEWVGATRFLTDVTAANLEGREPVPATLLWASSWARAGLTPSAQRTDSHAFATNAALARLGLEQGAGQVRSGDGTGWYVTGPVQLPEQLSALDDDVVVVERGRQLDERFDHLIVLTRTTDHQEAVARTLATLVDLDDPSMFSVSTSHQLAEVRSAVKGQLGSLGRTLAASITAVTAFLTGAILVVSVMQRRKDFGRRRALGASRSLIVTLIIVQTLVLSALGAAVGLGAAAVALLATDGALPGIDYLSAVAYLAVAVSLLSAIVPAAIASRRDPVSELRVP